MGKTNYCENLYLNYLRGLGALYVGLFLTMPTDGEAGTGGVEPAVGSYVRPAATFGAPVAGTMNNSAQVDFVTPTADWGDALGWGLWDAASGGNLLYISEPFASPKTIQNGDPVNFAAGALTVQEN